jgi:hypothetical protein
MVPVAQNPNHTLLSHLRLHQPGGPGSRIYVYVPQEQGGPDIPPGPAYNISARTIQKAPLLCCIEMLSISREYMVSRIRNFNGNWNLMGSGDGV